MLVVVVVVVVSSLSTANHIRDVISSCSQTLHAIRVLRAHGLSAAALHEVFRGIVIAKLLYAAITWWDFALASDKQRPAAFVKPKRQRFCRHRRPY